MSTLRNCFWADPLLKRIFDAKVTRSLHGNKGFVCFLGLSGSLTFIAGIITTIVFFPVNFDEGYNLQVPVNLIHFGIYGSRTIEGFVHFDPFISTGPIVLVPIAILFRMFGQGIVQARLIPSLYAIGILFISFLLTKRLYGLSYACLSPFLLAIVGGAYYWILGLVLGEGAGIFAVLLGLLAWTKAEEKLQIRSALLAGLCWGLAVWAKPSMVIALIVIMCSLFMSIRFKRDCTTLVLGASVTGLLVGISWFVWFWLLKGSIPPQGLLMQQFSLSITRNFVRNLPRFASSLGLPCLISSVLSSRKVHDRVRLRITSSVTYNLVTLWLLWWLLFNSDANHRHLFPGLVFGNILLANALLLDGKSHLIKATKIVLALLIAVNLFLPDGLINHFSGLKSALLRKHAQSEFALYIAGLDPDARILGVGWFMAWDISFLSGRTFGNLEETENIQGNGKTYVVITPTIRRYPSAYLYALELINKHSGKAIYDDSFGYTLYELTGP